LSLGAPFALDALFENIASPCDVDDDDDDDNDNDDDFDVVNKDEDVDDSNNDEDDDVVDDDDDEDDDVIVVTDTVEAVTVLVSTFLPCGKQSPFAEDFFSDFLSALLLLLLFVVFPCPSLFLCSCFEVLSDVLELVLSFPLTFDLLDSL